MNIVIMGGVRLTRDPDIRYSQDGKPIANYSIAVDRRFKREGGPEADFFDCTAFGKQAELAEKYLHKGTKINIQGELQNNNYQNRDGQTVRRNVIIVNAIDFCESRNASQDGQQYQGQSGQTQGRGRQARQEEDDFMNIPDGIREELPFN